MIKALTSHNYFKNRGQKMNKQRNIIMPAMSSWSTWRSPSVQMPAVSFRASIIKSHNLNFDKVQDVCVYQSMNPNNLIYHYWYKVGTDLSEAMLYYGLASRGEIERRVRSSRTTEPENTTGR